MISGIEDELCPDSVVLWTAVVKERIGQIRHSFTGEGVPTDEEHRILKTHRKQQVLQHLQYFTVVYPLLHHYIIQQTTVILLNNIFFRPLVTF